MYLTVINMQDNFPCSSASLATASYDGLATWQVLHPESNQQGSLPKAYEQFFNFFSEF
jgi:hypothetical protein